MKKHISLKTIVIVFVLAIFVGCAVYVGDYYHAEDDAIAMYEASMENDVIVTKLEDGNGLVVKKEESTDKGFIFYPGGKVEYTAYLPLMEACAEKGILCVLVEMPFNLAVLDVDRAEGILEQFPEIENWYIGGHSLGGSMAASYVASNVEDFAGLMLLGSYSTADLSESGLKVLSIYGSNDQVLNHEKYEKYQSNLPENFEEVIIEGGCHAYFGMYGEQKGDGVATISNIEQIEKTATEIQAFITK